jgi:C1A family cysteine protease
MSKIKKYTWKPDLPDYRDFSFSDKFLNKVTTLPNSIDLRSLCSPVEDQGQLGSCTGNALVGLLECNEAISKSPKFIDLSRLFVYYNERSIEGTIKTDSGAMIRDGIKSLNKLGVCSESLWPYNISKFKNKPTKQSFSDALSRKISSYYRLTSLNDMLTCLANGNPFVFGFSVYDSFESNSVASTGIVNLPTNGEKQLGGHAVCCVGYDQSTRRFLVRNSWGPNWGMKGYFTIPFDYLTNSNLADDFWTVTK